jgi:hypothetical protein
VGMVEAMRPDELRAFWEERQARLTPLVNRLAGCTPPRYRVDLDRNQFLWTRVDGAPLVAAETRLILTYASSSRSILMGWANESLPASAVVPRQPDAPDQLDGVTPADAGLAAMGVAYRAGAEFIYRAPEPQLLSFLALWKVRAATAADSFAPGPPHAFVMGLLDDLLELLRAALDGEEEALVGRTRALLVNQGHTLLERVRHTDGELGCAALERETGRALVALGESVREGESVPARTAARGLNELGALRARWASAD